MVGEQKRKIRWAISLLLVMLYFSGLTAQAQYGGGTGEPNDPYQIATAEQLISIGSDPNLMNKHFILVKDIELAGFDWRPIGIPGTEFNGVFDGKDHVVSELYIIDPNGFGYSGGSLFGYTGEHAIVKNLILTNSVSVAGVGSEYVGALVDNNRGTVKDCSVQAKLTGSHCGGLAGENAGLIFNCDVTCSVSSHQGLRRVGCLVGKNAGGSVFACQASGSITCGDESKYIGGAVGNSSWDATVVACSADVTISCGDKSERVGGLVGFNCGIAIAECYASGALIVGEQSNCIGGLVGENWSNVVNCYASGTVTAGNGAVDWGGLVGGLGSTGKVTGSYLLAPAYGGGPDNGIGVTLTDSQMRQRASFVGWDFNGNFEDGTTDFWQMPDNGGYPVLNMFDGYEPPVLAGAGTIDDPYLIESVEQLGFAARNPDACYRLIADMDMAGIVSTTAAVPLLYGYFDGNGHIIQNLTMTGGSYMGLFGMISPQARIIDLGVLDANISGPNTSKHVGIIVAMNKGTIARCYVAGTVIGEEYVGGLAGENIGEVTDCYANCSVTGAWHAGGLVGENDGTITTSYVNGHVSSAGDEWGIGALVGYNHRGSLVNCLWEKRAGIEINSDVCQGLTNSQMMNKEFYSLNGWAENPNWVIESGNAYPRLVWEGTSGEPIPVPTIDWLAGAGTPEDPYKIETVDQIKLIGLANVLWDKHFVLMADLDCSSEQFDRIGVCPGTGFSGNFDGENHRLKNLTLGSIVPRQRYMGLFGFIDPEGYVSRLVMENISVSCGALSGPVAALAAENKGTVVNCCATGSLDCGQACWGIGGLVGENYGVMESCYAKVTILADNESGKMGGLVGSNHGRISNSYSLGSVRGGSGIGWLGGLAGITNGPLIHCYTAVDINRKSAAAYPYNDIGGLVADDFVASTIVSCYFLGPDNGLGSKLSDQQMKKQESYVGWDFVDETENGTEDIWWILEGQDYPQLWWELLEDDSPALADNWLTDVDN